jgi:transcriptional regulator with XRE-family HTH domain
MAQETIGQRLKFLMDSLNLKVRTLASALDVSETNIRNYITKDSKPSSDILERIVQQYPQVHALWLLTGNGEPFILPANENNQTTAHAEKFFRSPVVGTNHGTAYQENNATPAAADVEALKTKLALAEKEVEHLKVQLAMKDALLTSKEETLALLRISFNRPN